MAAVRFGPPGLSRARRCHRTALPRGRAPGAFARLRFGELGALTRERGDLGAGTVAVTEAAIETTGGRRQIGEPKTEKGRRVVALPPQIVTELRKHLDR